MSTLLVIGGSGFFGKSILDAYWRGLLEPWGINKIIIMARNATTTLKKYPELVFPSNIDSIRGGVFKRVVELLDADICSCTSLPFAEYVIHAAASTDARDYLSRPQIERENIQKGVSNFCDLTKTYLRKSKILYVSSGAVYGQQPKDVVFLKEDAPLLPIESLPLNKQDYAAAKRDGESLIRQLGADGFNVIIARCFAFVGKYLPRDQHFAIGNFIEDGLKSRPINIKAKSLVYRSYMHADDLVLWLMKLMNHGGTDIRIFNVGSDKAVEIRDLASMIGAQFNVPIYASPLEFELIDRYLPSTQLASRRGCELNTDLKHAITKTIDALICKE
jgi:nucleoside-diphosphate-sugar epimerase